MDNLQQLLEMYRDDPRTTQIAEALSGTSPARLQLNGLVGAQVSFALTGTYLARPAHYLLIANGKEEAAYIQNNIAELFPKKSIHFFPDSFKRPMFFEELNNTNVLQRTETINRLMSSSSLGEIVVTYPEALFEKVVAPIELEKNKIEVKINEKLDADTLIDLMVQYGFERVDFVYEPGQFSIRGGIFDIFSYGNEFPYRVELFDDEVESIRTFDPTTQLSKQKIASVSIIPNINTRFTQSQKASLFKVLPEETTIWVENLSVLLDKLPQCFVKADAFAKTVSSLDEGDLASFMQDRAFIMPHEVIEDIEPFNVISFSISQQQIKLDQRIDYNSKPQPSFNKNFKLLIENLRSNMSKGLKNYIFAKNPRQIERFYAIFEDLKAAVEFHPISQAINEGFIDQDLKIACYTDHQIFERFHRFKLKKAFAKDQALNMKMLRELRPGDFVTHIDYGVGRYSGLEKLDINGHKQESVRLVYKNNDLLYVSINALHKISKYVGKEGSAPKLNKLGTDTWKIVKNRTKRKVKDIAKDLIKLYAQRKASSGFAFPPDGYLQNELEASFLFEDTPDQYKATQAVKEDMQKDYPMDRLICGDVGFGKTEIAVRAAFKAVMGGKQVAILVPTTILALQHAKTFKERLQDMGVTVDYVNRFRTTAEKKEIYEKLKSGEIDVVIGTHALLNKDIGFKDLGLLVIDEEQKFGVAAKEKLRNKKVNVDTLTLTATPIPRTLQFSLMSARDLSVINTPPPNRQPIHTEVRLLTPELVKESIYYEITRGGQVFFIHNRVKTLVDMKAYIQRLCPDLDIAMAHGQMESKNLEKTLTEFIERKYDVIVCTNIVGTGMDISNANTIMINNAHHFGMSDLHQLRGRVGRSNRKAFCYLLTPSLSSLTPDARKRLRTLEENSDLGSGFNIAMRDLDIRGAGSLLGGEQSGFIADIGYETYQKILEEAIQELKEKEFKDIFKEDLEQKRDYVRDVTLEADIEMLIPDDYISNIQERLNLYTELDNLKTEEELIAFAKKMEDRFGPLPKPVKELFEGLRLRWVCKAMGFERLMLKGQKLRCFFISNPQSPFFETDFFNSMVRLVSIHGSKKGFSFKKTTRHFILIKEGIKTLKQTRTALEGLLKAVDKRVKN
ncbi:MAG: transcription-repair coupling factor [Saprospiraceae bacterium]